VSQISSFSQCGMRYRIERRDGAPTGSAWWNVGGTAFHEIAEEILTRGVPLADWRAGGRESKAYPNREDRSWWLDNGPEMVAKYVLAQEGRTSEILRLVDGSTLALELGFMWRPAAAGLPPVKGFIDQALIFPDADTILIRDLKAGSQMPVDTLQLKLYRLALEDCFGVKARKWWGDYWHGRKGAATRGLDLTDRARVEEEVTYRLDTMNRAELAGLYLPNPGTNCSACGVREHCPAVSDKQHATWRRPVDAPSVSE